MIFLALVLYTPQKKEVFAQLLRLEKCFKFCYVYVFSFFIFYFEQLWVLPLWMPCSMLTKTRAFIRVKLKVAGNEKWKKKKNTWAFFSHKHNKLWSISLSQKVDRKPLLSEEWPTEPLECFVQPHGRPKSFIEKFHSNIIHS